MKPRGDVQSGSPFHLSLFSLFQRVQRKTGPESLRVQQALESLNSDAGREVNRSLEPSNLRIGKKKARSVIFRSDDLSRNIGQVTIRPVFSYSQSSSVQSSANAPDDADFDQALGAIEN